MLINDLWSDKAMVQYLKQTKMGGHKKALLEIIKNERIFRQEEPIPVVSNRGRDKSRVESVPRSREPVSKQDIRRFRERLEQVIRRANESRRPSEHSSFF